MSKIFKYYSTFQKNIQNEFRYYRQKTIEKVFYLTIAFIVSIIFFGMPMAKTLSVNPEYTSLANLTTWQAETKNNVYEFGGFCPEMIWAYGKPIKRLSSNKTIIPTENSFGVLVSEDQEKKFLIATQLKK